MCSTVGVLIPRGSSADACSSISRIVAPAPMKPRVSTRCFAKRFFCHCEDASIETTCRDDRRELQRIRDKAFKSLKAEKQTSELQDVESKKKEKTGHGSKPQPKLEMVEERHPLKDADTTCTSCDGTLGVWEGQYEESFDVDVILRRVVLKCYFCQKHRCACGGCIETAPGPVKLCEGACSPVDFASEVATCKLWWPSAT